MKLNELKPPAPPEPPPAWRLQLEQFWREATDLQRIDMRVTLEMGDGAGAQRILESWQRELEERRRKRGKKKKPSQSRRFQYGVYGGWFYPGYHNDAGTDSSSDGADGGGGESIQEQRSSDITDILPRFVEFCCDQLEIDQRPRIRLRRDPAWSERNGTFGRFDHDTGVIDLAVAQRHPLDVLRTLAHELVHHRQDQEHPLPADAGETGSVWEDEANALAGRIMRDFVKSNSELFGQDLEEGWRERAAALGAAACVAGTPGCATTGTTAADALKTVQTIGRTAQNLPTRAGAEEELRQELKNLLRRQRTGTQEDYSPDDPPGPETKPTMPAGTVRVDVSDMYGWYKIGQHISDLKGLGRHDFGKGPPSTIMAFGDEDLEHEYIQDLKRTGLDVTDLDPAEHRPMKGQKTDPTYNVAESSGYIPTEAEKDDPRFSMALTTDIRPGETGRQANKLGLKTDSQGRPDLLMKKLTNLLESVKSGDPVQEAQELQEVEMNPGTFRRFLASPEAEGIRAGFEAELIFRDVQSDESGESEPDYDQDQRTSSISDIIDFFTGGENGISGRAARQLETELQEQYMDWVQESFDEGYFDLARFQEWADDVIWPEVEDQYRDHARENLDDPDASDEDIEKEAITLFHDDVERNWDRSDQWYDRAREELYDEYAADQDESDWLDQSGLRYMSDIGNQWNLDWPYWTEGGNEGGREWEDIGASLEGVTGLPVRVGTGYHSMRRRPGEYVIEPDGSLEPDDSTDFGLEIVSPPLPLPEAIEQLRRVISWAEGAGNAYTNSSTGLHMGMSLPYKGGDVDPIKLILFMGDKNLLEQFERESNTYARSAYDRLRSRIKDMRNAGPRQISGVMDLMRRNLIELADRDLKGGVLGQKYVSVNPHDGYIEFRGPGGDYLAREDEIDGILENTMMRLAYAMHIAGRPDLYRQEYAKKLYKALTGFKGAETAKSGRDTRYRTEIETETDDPFMRLFSDYSAGTLSGQELKRKWADAVLAAEQPKPAPGASDYARLTTEYEVFNRSTGEVLDTFRAHEDNDAVDRALNKYSGQGIDFGVRRKSAEKKPASRRAELAKRVLDRPLVWHVEDTNDGRVIMVQAADRDSARREARRIDPEFNRLHYNDPDSFVIRAATPAETQQYLQQQADDFADSTALQARLGAVPGARSDPNALAPGERDWLVSWSEYRDRNGREEQVNDSLRTVARTAAEASQRLIDSLRMQGRQPFNVTAEPTDPPAWRAPRPLPTSGEPIPGSTLDIQRRRQLNLAQDLEDLASAYSQGMAGGEFAGTWQIRDAQGRVLHTFGGVGNVQADANRYAAGWLGRNRPDLAGSEIEVTPEMR